MTLTYVAIPARNEAATRAFHTFYDASEYFVDAEFDDGRHVNQDVVQFNAFSQDGHALGVVNSYYIKDANDA